MAVIALTLASVGLLCGILMFWKTNEPPITKRPITHTLTIIIPARNEALRIEPLLQSLAMQSWKGFNVLVVDDGSTDDTAAVATSYGARVVTSEMVGSMTPGKANACAYGAKRATGDWLLFLDADVQLADEHSLSRMMTSFYAQHGKGILSVQPYHRIMKPYENLSAIFNVIVLTGMNVFTVWQSRLSTAGSFGPCILCDRQSYEQTGGHEAAEESIMDDFALSEVFIEKQLPVTNYVGRGIINMRMYEEGIGQLVEGWTKNLATASQSTHRAVMALIQGWIFGVIMVVVAVVLSISSPLLIVSSLLYVAYGVHMYVLVRRAGNFHLMIMLAYPLYVLFFTCIFMYSLYRTHVLHSVMWRGRKIKV